MTSDIYHITYYRRGWQPMQFEGVLLESEDAAVSDVGNQIHSHGNDLERFRVIQIVHDTGKWRDVTEDVKRRLLAVEADAPGGTLPLCLDPDGRLQDERDREFDLEQQHIAQESRSDLFI